MSVASPGPADGRPSPQNDDSKRITYLYLTFETPLPQVIEPPGLLATSGPRAPKELGQGGPQPTQLPPCPDLSPYTCPLGWPQSRKFLLIILSCMATFLTAYTAGSYSPPSKAIAEDLATTQLAVLAGITTFCMGFALAPMALAPLSELWGRYPIFVVSGIVYVVFEAVCAVAPNLATMLVARFLVGVGGSVFSSGVGGVISDMWTKEERNTPMAIFSGSALAGTGAGPLVTSIMMKRLGHGQRHSNNLAWKWTFWHQVIAGAVLMLIIAVLFRETRGSVLLARKAKALNEWYEELEKVGVYPISVVDDSGLSEAETQVGALSDEEKSMAGGASPIRERSMSTQSLQPRRVRWRVKRGGDDTTLGKMILTSIYRPFHMLFTEPIVFFFSLWCAFAWAVLYLTFGSIPLVFARVHGLDIEESGNMFSAMIIGSVAATVVSIWQEKLLRYPQWRQRDGSNEMPYSDSRFWAFMRKHFPAESPESRLYFSCITSIFLPLGLFLFGFTARPDYHWAAPAVGIGLATWGIYSVYLATFNYLADSYHIFASSALAAQSCCRNVLGGVFPLLTGFIFRNMGEARAGGMLGGIATGLTVIPWVLVFFGDRIRAHSRFAKLLENGGD